MEGGDLGLGEGFNSSCSGGVTRFLVRGVTGDGGWLGSFRVSMVWCQDMDLPSTGQGKERAI